jgi:inosine-uridine nucleoside N-ribohydrolase
MKSGMWRKASLIFSAMDETPIVYIDTDIGLGTPGAEIDDAAALMMLLRNSNIQIAGIGSVFGNVPVGDAVSNLARLVKSYGRSDIPLGIGADCPLKGDLGWFTGWQEGYGETLSYDSILPESHSSDLLIDCILRFPGKVAILALGPMTNIALVVQKSPEIVAKVKEVIAMGGTFGKNSSQPEFNIHCDPTAADIVIHAGWPVTLLGLEITRKAAFSKAEFMAIEGVDPTTRLLKSQAAGWIDRVVSMGWEKDGCALHDAVAAAYFLKKKLFKAVRADVQVSIHEGPTWGITTTNETTSSSGNIQVIKEMDVERCRDLIWKCIDRKRMGS